MLDYGYNPGDIGFRSSPGDPVRMPFVMPPAGAPPRQLSPAQPVQSPYMMPPPSGAPLRWPPQQGPVTMPWLTPRTAFPRTGQIPRYTGTSPKPPRFSIGSEAILALLNSL